MIIYDYLILSVQVHVSKQFNIPDHCRAYALSYPKDKDYQMTFPHDHLETCNRCELLTSVLADIHDALEKMSHYLTLPSRSRRANATRL